ncbi:MAG: hypothetical protein OQK09_01365 [Colwellia sp.]|nr:hypothetical protein [Colwellia sp.]MCW8865674.1 hypothetical protein [Colwellia sp.]MCW9080138.1 hypothetical protein [Colwellia sp.]
MSIQTFNKAMASKIQVELPSNILIQLLNSGLLHCSDCKCLNADAKKVLWQALLTSTAHTELSSEEQLCA